MRNNYLLVLLIIICFGAIVPSANAWFYPDQPYRIPITVTSPGSLSTYQVLIDLNSQVLTGDTNANFWLNTNTSGTDIRFSNKDDNASLDYFREFFNNDANAHIWVEIPALIAGDQNIFMYYGSSTTTDVSNFERTFIDDGNGTTMLGWSLTKDAGNDWTSTGTQYTNDSTTGTQHMSRSRTFSNALAYAVSVELQNTASGGLELRYYLFDEGSVNTPYVQYRSSTNIMELRPSGDDGPICTISISDGTLYDVNVTRDYAGTWRMYTNNTSCALTDKTDVSGSSHGFSHAGDNTSFADSIWLKNTSASGEPTYRVLSFQDDQNFTMRVVDEETTNGLQATVTVNGQPVSVNSNGFFDVNAFVLSYPVTIAVSMTGYDSRTFQYGSSEGLQLDSVLGLRVEAESRDIGFIFYAPDETTKLTDRYITVRRGGITSGRGLTNANAMITFNLAPQDSAYTFRIYSSGSDSNIQYTYPTVSVTVRAPLNESNNTTISSPGGFNFSVGGLGLQNINGQTSFPFTSIVILGNTEQAYTLRVVDNNATLQQYFARNYVMHAIGDINNIVIQPYLIDLDEGTLLNIRVIDLSTNITVPNVRFTMSIGINNVLTVVEDTITDSAGVAQVTMLGQRTYNVDITDVPQDINYFSGTLNPNVVAVYINFNPVDSNFAPLNISYKIAPPGDTVSGVNQTFDVNVSADFPVQSFLVQAIDGNRVVSSTSSTNNPFNASLTVALADFNTSQVIIRTTVVGFDQNTVINKTYTITSLGSGGLLNLVNLRNNLSPLNVLIFMVIGIIGLVVILGPGIGGNNDAQVFVVAIGMGLMVFLFFREFFLYMIGAVLAGAIAWLWVRSNR